MYNLVFTEHLFYVRHVITKSSQHTDNPFVKGGT